MAKLCVVLVSVLFHCIENGRDRLFLVKADLEKMNVLSRRAIDNADKRIKTLEVDVSKWQMVVEAEKKRVAEVRRHTILTCTGRSLDQCGVYRPLLSRANAVSTCVS